MVAAAVLRRLEGVRVGLERDLAEAEAAIARAESDAQRARDEAERLEVSKRDAEGALARLAEEVAALAPSAGRRSCGCVEAGASNGSRRREGARGGGDEARSTRSRRRGANARGRRR